MKAVIKSKKIDKFEKVDTIYDEDLGYDTIFLKFNKKRLTTEIQKSQQKWVVSEKDLHIIGKLENKYSANSIADPKRSWLLIGKIYLHLLAQTNTDWLFL